MTLRRTASALHSLNIFYKVDTVVFCEGGESLSYENAIIASRTDGTLDSLYWESVIGFYQIDKTYHVKSVGSKSTLKQLAEDVRDRNISTISICMDADYERILGGNCHGPRVAWTMGYSWENDVVSPPVLESIISMFLGNGAASAAAIDNCRERILRMGTGLSRWTEIDISLCARGRSGIFDREKPLAAIDMTDPPTARQDVLLQRLTMAGYQRRPKRVVSVQPDDVGVVCFGKMISRALYHAILAALRSVSAVRLDYEVFMRIAISETLRAVAAGTLPNHLAHIQSQRSAFV